MIPALNCCTSRGLLYPDGQQRCRRHETDADRQLRADLDARAKRILGPSGWPYGPNIDVAARQRLLVWAGRYGLKRANTPCQGLHWLRKSRCGVGVCQPDGGGWMDHVTRWTRDGRAAVLISQPYGLHDAAVKRLAELAEDFEVHVHGSPWYGHGTVAVEVWNADAYAEYLRNQSETTEPGWPAPAGGDR